MGIFKMVDKLGQALNEKVRHGKINGPEFFNQDSTSKNIETLKELLDKVGDDQKEIIEKEIRLAEIGQRGEENVIYELKHSKENILVLHDITIEDSVKDSQIDFLVISRSAIIVLETKKLSGDIEINNDGEFIRYYKNAQGKVYKKEGIYSPITQNEYHINAVRDLLQKNKLIKNLPFYSLVVLANPRTIINKTYAKKEIKEKIVKHDQLNYKLREIIKPEQYNEFDISDSRMYEIADLLIKSNQPRQYDYINKFKLNIDENNNDIEVIDEDTVNKPVNDDVLYEKLRAFRFHKAKELNMDKIYYIFNNEELAQLVLNRPKTKEELLKIKGFGEYKYNQFGEDLLKLINSEETKELSSNKQILQNIEDNNIFDKEQLIKELKEYRMKRSVLENIKPYMIFNNAEMDDLIEKHPTSKEELLNVKGFGSVKVDKYGNELLNILNKK